MNKTKPYSTSSPKLIPSFVCHVDILGYSQMSREAIKAGDGEKFLRKLRKALTTAYSRVRETSKGWGGDEYFSVKTFTDNIIVGYPLPNFPSNSGESELGHIFSIFSEFQIGLAIEGFLTRGGIAFGSHYMDNEIVFGDALLEAVNQDKSGGAPCISIAPSAIKILQHHLGFYGQTSRAPQYQDLLSDPDGSIYLNYLDNAFIAFPDGGMFFEVFDAHKETIENGLKKHKSSPSVRAKYEWAARYHNFICLEFIEKHPVPTHPDVDEVYATAAIEAEKLLQYQIDIDSFAAIPSRINLKPLS